MTIFSIIIAFVLLLFLFIFFFKGCRKKTSNTLIILLILYDWIFINLSYYLPNNIVFVLKSSCEILIILLLVILMIRTRKKTKISKFDLRFLGLLGIPFLVSIISGGDLSLALSGYKDYFFPYILAFLLLKCHYLNVDYRILTSITLIVTSGAILQTIFFNGNLTSLWFYDSFSHFDENPIDVGYYNYLKENSLRATSCFVSPIDLSIISAILVLYHLSNIVVSKCHIKQHFVLMVCALIALLLSQTRVGVIIVVIGMLTLGVIQFKWSKISLLKLYVIPISFIIITFILMAIGMVGDESALGRIVQYITFFDSFSLFGAGIGDYNALFKYDSFLLCTLRMMGIAAILYLSLYFYLFKFIVNLYKSKRNFSFCMPFVLSSANALIYAFVFQHLAGSIALTLIIIFMLDLVANPNK